MLDEWTHVVGTQRRLEEINGIEMEDLQIVFLIRSSVTTSKRKYGVVKPRKWLCSCQQNYEPSDYSKILSFDETIVRRTRSNNKVELTRNA